MNYTYATNHLHPYTPNAMRPKTSARSQPSWRFLPTHSARTPNSSIGASARATVIQGTFLSGKPRMAIQSTGHHGTVGTVHRASPIRHRAAPVQPAAAHHTAFSIHALPPSGPGQSLPVQVQSKMKAALGTDFSDVRVNVGSQAPSIGALADTHGPNIYLAPGRYNPNL